MVAVHPAGEVARVVDHDRLGRESRRHGFHHARRIDGAQHRHLPRPREGAELRVERPRQSRRAAGGEPPRSIGQREERDTRVRGERHVGSPPGEDARIGVDVNETLVGPEERELLARDVVEPRSGRDHHVRRCPRLPLERRPPDTEVAEVRRVVVRKAS